MEDISRFVVVKTLSDIEEKKAYSNIKLNYYFKKYNLSHIDRAFSTEILYGTIRWKLRIDYVIQKFSKLKLKDMSPWVLSCIETALYQIFFMNKVPDFAAVNQAVEIAKKKGKGPSGFVNGILRNILRNKDDFYNIDIKDEVKRYSIEYSHPEWYVRKFINILGEDTAKDMMMTNNEPPNLTIRVNTLKCKKDELKTELSKDNVEIKDGILEDSLILKGFSLIEQSNEYKNGLFTVQDESSMLAVKVLDPKPKEKILDLCSAPGGKATYMAQIMENKGKIKSFDIYQHKLNLINENAKRLGISIIETNLKDSTIYMEEYTEYAGKVLVDAPCSGLGLVRKKPEIRWNVKQEDIDNLEKVQYVILNNAAKYVKKGGVLVYSTCTITTEENEKVINKFLINNTDYELDNIEPFLPESIKGSLNNKGYIKLFPNIHGTDGFFIARLRRKQ